MGWDSAAQAPSQAVWFADSGRVLNHPTCHSTSEGGPTAGRQPSAPLYMPRPRYDPSHTHVHADPNRSCMASRAAYLASLCNAVPFCAVPCGLQVTSPDDLGTVVVEVMLPAGLEPLDPDVASGAGTDSCGLGLALSDTFGYNGASTAHFGDPRGLSKAVSASFGSAPGGGGGYGGYWRWWWPPCPGRVSGEGPNGMAW